MWLSNTATCLLMLPIVKNILDSNFNTSDDNEFSKFLILSIAYASSIGGMATPIGTIPNAVMIGFLKETIILKLILFSGSHLVFLWY
ncbi:MAG: hypothetical protein CM15mP40_05340 [Alphaproteobacteria bacterium]|nr:MAG: hypothetical protein CM15mP40_05340 [Alphaproteobacteria bacterium]